MEHPILFVCKDPGGTNGILPVYDTWRRSGGSAVLIANGAATTLLSDRGIAYRWYPSVAAVMEDIPNPAALVTSMCSRGGLGRDLVPVLRRTCPTISLQDIWGARLNTDWADPSHRPAFIVVNDRVGADIVQRAWPEFDASRIAVLGYPALDRYATLDVAETGSRVRAELRIAPEEHVVLVAGDLVRIGEFLEEVVAALNATGEPTCLLPRPHPRMRTDAPTNIERWDGAIRAFTAGRVIDSSGCTTDECVAAASVVVATSSTVLVEAAVIRKPCIAVLYPEVGMAQFLRGSGGIMEEFVPVQLGACAKATDHSSLIAALRAARDGALAAHLRPAQERAFVLDGRNAERTAAFIRERMSTFAP